MINQMVFMKRRNNESHLRNRYMKRDLIELGRGTGCPTLAMEHDTSATHAIRMHRKWLKITNTKFLDLWWRTRGYEIV